MNNKTSFKTRLGFGIIFSGVIMALGVAMSWLSTSRMENYIVQVQKQQQISSNLSTLQRSATSTLNALETMVYAKDPAIAQHMNQRIQENRKTYQAAAGQLKRLIQTPEEKAQFAALLKARDDSRDVVDEARDLALAGNYADAKTTLEQRTQPAYSKHIEAAASFLKDREQAAIHETEVAHALAQQTRFTLLGGGAISLVVISFLGLFLMKSLVRSLVQVRDALQKVTKGDLRVQVPVETKDELGDIATSANQMVEQLRLLTSEMRKNAENLHSAASVQKSASASLAGDMEEQSNQTTHLSTAMEEMSATSIEVARRAEEIADSARRTSIEAQGGAQVIRGTLNGMEQVASAIREAADTVSRLGDSSQQIGTIIATINEIAEQTNLLALNAAIEAARAGEQGRGFAVVADEVRKLAERTGNATREISGMIQSIQTETKAAVQAMETSRERVEDGTHHAREAGQALDRINSATTLVTDQISAVATAAEEQSSVANEISQSIEKIASNTHNINDAIQETRKKSSELEVMATTLKDLVGRFRS